MRNARIAKLAAAVGLCATAAMPFAAGWANDGAASSVLGDKLPPGYRDWRLISVAREEGKLNDIRAILGNDMAIKAFRDGTLPFQNGTIIARVGWSDDSFPDGNRSFGHPQSFVSGHPKNGVQFMVKDSAKYASTGGWGFAQFDGGKPTAVVQNTCFSCHETVKTRDFVFARYAS
jgi:hypothetical protein